MEKSNYKVIILGAGVAGLSAALFLHKKGIDDVLVINSTNHTIHKACSGILTDKSINLLNIIGINPLNYIKTTSIEAYYNGVFSRSYDSKDVYLYQNICLNRSSLDEQLYEKCISENIHIEENVKNIVVDEISSSVNSIHYDYLIDARGFSIIANKCRRKSIGIEAKITLENAGNKFISPKIFLGDSFKGYGWIVSYNNNITIGFTDLYKKSLDLHAKLKDFAKNNGIVINDKTSDIRAAFIPLKPVKKLYKNNIVFIGDRAGLVDPLSQEGIFYALYSAMAAAEAINNNDLLSYKKSLKEIVRSLNFASSIREGFFKKKIQKTLWNISQKHQFVTYVFSLYSRLSFFDYTKIFKYHKEYKHKK